MNEIVKYRNELNKVALRNFKSKELDLFIAIISRMRDKEEEVTFSFDYLKNILNLEWFDFLKFYSDFDYKSQSTLFIPTDLWNIKNSSQSISNFLKEFYEKEIWEKPVWTIPKIFTYIFEKKYNLSEKRENTLKNGEIVIFPKEYFYPYGFKEIYSDDCIKPETYGIHWWNDSWSSLKARLFLETKHLSGVKKLIKKMRIIARFYLKEKR